MVSRVSHVLTDSHQGPPAKKQGKESAHLPRLHAATIDLDPGESRFDLAKVRECELDIDRADVLAQVVDVRCAASRTRNDEG